MRRFGKIFGTVLMFVLIAGITGAIVFAAVTISEAPSLSEVDFTPEGYLTTIVDDEEEVMVTLAGSEANRVYTDLEKIPETLQQAFVAIEDSRFYQHHGIDLKGIARAVWKGISSGGNFHEGASTITQQLLKNNVFTDWTSEETMLDRVSRKIQEQWLALALERAESKETILENYLNTINLGAGTWGVEAASRRYFNKDVWELDLAECSVIAGITKNPSAYNPIKYPEACRERQELVLLAMKNQGYITDAQYQEALEEDVYGEIEANHTDATAEVLSYFEDTLVLQILDEMMETLGYTEEQAWDQIYRGGLTIYSTQNTRLQAIAEEEINNDDRYGNDAQASLVILDVETGQVKAIVGGRGEKEASLILNRANTSLRQPGSTIKIIGEYAAAMDAGLIDLATVQDDAPYSYSNGDSIKNASETYSGMTTVKESIVRSLNVTALKTFQTVGQDAVWDMLEDFGITTLTDADRVEALALGGTSGGVTNLEMTAAYNTIANGGEYVEPVYYTKVVDHDGNVILESSSSSHQVLSESTAALLTAAMEDVITDGTGVRANFDGMAIAGKSGTTNSSRDTWFVGYSPYLTCGVWSGYDSNDTQENSNNVKNIWKAVMQRASEGDAAVEEFPCVEKLSQAEICKKCGKRAIEGVCDSSEQGDMTCRMYFAPGTVPVSSCDCHVSVEICRESGQQCSSYCPSSKRETHVYLKSGTEGTEDAAYVMPEKAEQICETHKYFWNQWEFGHSGEENGGTESGSGSENGNGYGYDNGNGYGYGYDNGNGYGHENGDSYGQNGGHDSHGEDDSQGDWWDSFTGWLFG